MGESGGGRKGAEPGGGACLTVLPQQLERCVVKRGEHVVTVNTGSAEEYIPTLRQLPLYLRVGPALRPPGSRARR